METRETTVHPLPRVLQRPRQYAPPEHPDRIEAEHERLTELARMIEEPKRAETIPRHTRKAQIADLLAALPVHEALEVAMEISTTAMPIGTPEGGLEKGSPVELMFRLNGWARKVQEAEKKP